MSHAQGDAQKVVVAALVGNLGIAACKFFAVAMTSSSATLAEAVHSLADTGNQALLLVGMVLARRGSSDVYAFGRAAERYFWPFVVALVLFSVGGAFAIYEGVHKLMAPSRASGSAWWSIVVLGASLLIEAASFSVACKEFRKASGRRGVAHVILHGKDPTIPLVLMEDTSAMVGLVIALGAVAVSAATGARAFDALGSILIGIMLCVTASVLAVQTHSLLIGESATPEMRTSVLRAAQQTPGVERVTQMLTLHLGPDEVLGALKVAFKADLTVDQIEQTTNEMERQIRANVPVMKRLFIEVDAHGDMRGIPAEPVSAASREPDEPSEKKPLDGVPS